MQREEVRDVAMAGLGLVEVVEVHHDAPVGATQPQGRSVPEGERLGRIGRCPHAVQTGTQREIAADDFFLGMFTTALAPGEVIWGVRFPRVRQSAYAKFRHPASGYAMAGVFLADFGAQGRRVAVTGATDVVCRWPQAEAAWQAGQPPAPFVHEGLLDDIHAPARYRAHLTDLMFAQALAHLR